MIVEYIRYKIPVEIAAAFERDYAQAAASLDSSAHCLAYELSSSVEEPASYVLRIEWDSAEGHMQGFRNSDSFRSFFKAIKPYLDRIEEMRHYQPSGVKRIKLL
jgi:quinol monooxygenase YgiN